MSIETINPATGERLKTYDTMGSKQALDIVDSCHNDYNQWREVNFDARAKLMRTAANSLLAQKNAFAELIALEMGKPITQGIAEIEKCALVCNFYADNAETFLSPRHINSEHHKSFVCYRPLGIVFAIMPWNYPFWQVFRFACPTLMAGNGAILKHAPISTGAALAIENVFRSAGFPKHLFRTLIIKDSDAESVIASPKITAVTLTGSERAGSIVGSIAARHLKKVVLELGGSDPYVICEDADLELAASEIVASRMNNTGQVCIAAKRVIACQSIIEELQENILNKLSSFQMGSPLDSNCNFGPMARADLREELHNQVLESVNEGAALLLGGKIPEGNGFYYPPTLLCNVTEEMTAFKQELFGPVICLVEAANEDEAIRLANQTKYVLGGAVFTRNLEKGEEIARNRIETGACFVNGLVSSDPRFPFGGIKMSGFGRELSQEGIREFVNTKSVVIKKG